MQEYKGFQLQERVKLKPKSLGKRLEQMEGVIVKFHPLPFDGGIVTYCEVQFSETESHFCLPAWLIKCSPLIYVDFQKRERVQKETNAESLRQDILDNAELLSDPEMDADALKAITDSWMPEFKKAVWSELPVEVKTRLRLLTGGRQ